MCSPLFLLFLSAGKKRSFSVVGESKRSLSLFAISVNERQSEKVSSSRPLFQLFGGRFPMIYRGREDRRPLSAPFSVTSFSVPHSANGPPLSPAGGMRESGVLPSLCRAMLAQA